MTDQELVTREKQELKKSEEQTRAGRYYTPQVDIYESPDGLKLIADMPGVTDKNVDVTLENRILTILGKVSTKLYDNLSPAYTEYNVGNYFRQFEVNEDIDAAKIQARMRNGVLELMLPKAEHAQPRKIEVRSA